MEKLTTHAIMLAKIKAHRDTRRIIEESLNEENIAISQWLLLGVLADGSQKNMGEVADCLDIKLPLVSRYVKELEARDLLKVTHDDSDRRTKFVAISDKGIELLQSTEPKVKAAIKHWLHDIPNEDIDSYVKVLRILGSRVD